MPRPIPSYRFHKASGQALVTLNGKDFYLGPWNSEQSRVAYDRLIAEWTANGRQLPSVVEFGNLSVAELLAAYLRHAAVYYSSDGVPTSEYVCMKDAIRPVREIYSRTPVKDFGPLALKAVRQVMVDTGTNITPPRFQLPVHPRKLVKQIERLLGVLRGLACQFGIIVIGVDPQGPQNMLCLESIRALADMRNSWPLLDRLHIRVFAPADFDDLLRNFYCRAASFAGIPGGGTSAISNSTSTTGPIAAGRSIKSQLRAVGIRQDDLAHMLGRSQSYVSRLLDGQVPSAKSNCRFASIVFACRLSGGAAK